MEARSAALNAFTYNSRLQSPVWKDRAVVGVVVDLKANQIVVATVKTSDDDDPPRRVAVNLPRAHYPGVQAGSWVRLHLSETEGNSKFEFEDYLPEAAHPLATFINGNHIKIRTPISITNNVGGVISPLLGHLNCSVELEPSRKYDAFVTFNWHVNDDRAPYMWTVESVVLKEDSEEKKTVKYPRELLLKAIVSAMCDPSVRFYWLRRQAAMKYNSENAGYVETDVEHALRRN